MNQNKNNLKNYQEQVLGKIKEIDDIKKEINYQSIIDILHNLNNDLKKLKEGHNSSLKKDLLNDQEIINFEKKIKKLEQKKAKNQAKFTNLNNKQKELFKIFKKKIKNENKFYQKLNQRIDNTLNTNIDKKVDDKYSFDVKNLNV